MRGNLAPEDEAFYAAMVPGIVWEFAHDQVRFTITKPLIMVLVGVSMV